MLKAVRCGQCGSERLYRDGFRYLDSGESVQRWLCRSCGFRFSDPNKSYKECQTIQKRQICTTLARVKNLTATQETKTCAVTRKDTPTENEVKAAPQIERLLVQLQNDGRKPGTIGNYRKAFTRLLRANADLYDPENTKAALSKLPIKDSTKKNMTAILDVWFSFNEIPWRAPRYSAESEIPYIPTEIPTEQEIDQLIAALGKKTATFCQLLKETGARAGEIANLTWTSIDFQTRTVRIKAEKGSNSRIMPLSPKALDMLCNLSRDREKMFANADDMRSCFFLQKRRIAKKLANPRLLEIHFHTFRHWKATTEQHKTKDPWHVKTILGHKSIKSTETYIHIEKMLYQNEANDQFTVRVAHTLDEAIQLMEVGYEFHCQMEGNKLFRKRK